MPDITEVWRVITLPTVTGTVLVGLLAGAFYLFEVRARGMAAPVSLLVTGWAFLVTVAIARDIDGSPEAMRNLGLAILWALFCLFCAFGIALRRRTWRGL